MFIFPKSRIAAAAALSMLAPAAFAGGYTAPVEPTPVIMPEAQAVANWAGAYAGGSVGYSFAGDDDVGLEFYEDDEPFQFNGDLGKVKISGPTAGLHVGYRLQRNRWTWGPELGVEFGNVDDEDDLEGRPNLDAGGKMKTEMNHILSLRFKTGYLVDERTMVFGSAGVVRGDFDYKLTGPDGDSAKESDKPYGYSLGLGVERKMTERMSLTAEYEYRNFGKKNINFDGGLPEGDYVRTEATPEHHNVKMGLNFSF